VINSDNNVLAFERSFENEKIVVALNFGPETRQLPAPVVDNASVLLSTHMDLEGVPAGPTLRGNEGIVLHKGS
jgi:hypothetical protein